MKTRALSPTGDYQFGRSGIFLQDSPEAVAQVIRTRLGLWSGEWYLDSTEGTPYMQQILGAGTQGTRDLAIRDRILGTPGVQALLSYQSSVNNRSMSVTAVVQTPYGAATINVEV